MKIKIRLGYLVRTFINHTWFQSSKDRGRTVLAAKEAHRRSQQEAAEKGEPFCFDGDAIARKLGVPYGEVVKLLDEDSITSVQLSDCVFDGPFVDIVEFGSCEVGGVRRAWAIVYADSRARVAQTFKEQNSVVLPEVPPAGTGGRIVMSYREGRFVSMMHRPLIREADGTPFDSAKMLLAHADLLLLCDDATARECADIQAEQIIALGREDVADRIGRMLWDIRKGYGPGWLPSAKKLCDSLDAWKPKFATALDARSSAEVRTAGIPAYKRQVRTTVAQETSLCLEQGWLPRPIGTGGRIFVAERVIPSAWRVPRLDVDGEDRKWLTPLLGPLCASDPTLLVFTTREPGVKAQTRMISPPVRTHAQAVLQRWLPEMPCNVIGIVPSTSGDSAWLGLLLRLVAAIHAPRQGRGVFELSTGATRAQMLLSAAIDKLPGRLMRQQDGADDLRIDTLRQALDEGRDLADHELACFGRLGHSVRCGAHPYIFVRSGLVDKMLTFARHYGWLGGFAFPASPLFERLQRPLGMAADKLARFYFRFLFADNLGHREILKEWQKSTWGKVISPWRFAYINRPGGGRRWKEIEKIATDAATLFAKMFRSSIGFEDTHRKTAAKHTKLTVIKFVDEPLPPRSGKRDVLFSKPRTPFSRRAIDLKPLVHAMLCDCKDSKSWIGGKLDATNRNCLRDSSIHFPALVAALELDASDSPGRFIMHCESGLLARMALNSERAHSIVASLLAAIRNGVSSHSDYVSAGSAQKCRIERWIRDENRVLIDAFDAARVHGSTALILDWQRLAAGLHGRS